MVEALGTAIASVFGKNRGAPRSNRCILMFNGVLLVVALFVSTVCYFYFGRGTSIGEAPVTISAFTTSVGGGGSPTMIRGSANGNIAITPSGVEDERVRPGGSAGSAYANKDDEDIVESSHPKVAWLVSFGGSVSVQWETAHVAMRTISRTIDESGPHFFRFRAQHSLIASRIALILFASARERRTRLSTRNR